MEGDGPNHIATLELTSVPLTTGEVETSHITNGDKPVGVVKPIPRDHTTVSQSSSHNPAGVVYGIKPGTNALVWPLHLSIDDPLYQVWVQSDPLIPVWVRYSSLIRNPTRPDE